MLPHEEAKRTPTRLPSQLGDRMLDRHALFGHMMIQLELEFRNGLDADRLSRAIDLTLDAEPILGCRLVANVRRPWWERLEELRQDTLLATSEQTTYETFKNRPIDAYAGPQLEACLIHSSGNDHLLLKVSHYAADAAGVKDVAATVSSTYRRLANEPSYQPTPNLRGSRSTWQVLQRVSWLAYPRLYLECARGLRERSHTVPHKLSIGDGPHTPLDFIYRCIPADRVARFSGYRRTHNATINDMMVAALFRALTVVSNWDGRTQLELNTTVDLRRYLPGQHAQAVANLSITTIGWPSLGTDLGNNFASTLARVTDVTQRRKTDWLGIGDLLFLAPIFALLPHNRAMQQYYSMAQKTAGKRGFAPSFTNTGLISEESVTFEAAPLNAWILPPPMFPPLMSFSLSGYSGSLTMAAGVCPATKHTFERFFDAILSELPS